MYTKVSLENYRVVFITICANLISFCVGTYIGWTSPVIPKLRDQTEDSPLSYSVTAAQEGWISSLSSIGALIVCPFIGFVASAIGRKWTLLLSSLIMAVSYVFLILATDIWFIYVARTLQGIGGGGGASIIPMYIGEIATDETRGAVGSLNTIFVLCGIIFTYIIGPYVSFVTLQYCCMAGPILFFVIFLFMPETPYYYAIKGKESDLIKCLQILRGKSDVEQERAKIQNEVDASMLNRGRLIDILRNRVYRRALIIVCGLMFFQQMSGTSAVTFNSQSIFINAESTLDPALATIILGVVQLISNFITPFVVERAGRKIVLMTSSIGMAISLVVLGTFFFIQEINDASNILWVPVPALITFTASFGFGFGPLPWVLLGEIFPSNIKSTTTSIACTCTFTVAFVVTRYFPELNALGAYYAFWLFSGFCVMSLIFVKFVVIETKGLSLQMIQEKLQRES